MRIIRLLSFVLLITFTTTAQETTTENKTSLGLLFSLKKPPLRTEVVWIYIE